VVVVSEWHFFTDTILMGIGSSEEAAAGGAGVVSERHASTDEIITGIDSSEEAVVLEQHASTIILSGIESSEETDAVVVAEQHAFTDTILARQYLRG